jgi:hypothetical protein
MKGSLGAELKLLPCDHEITDLSRNGGKDYVQKTQVVWSFPGYYASGSYLHRTVLFYYN